MAVPLSPVLAELTQYPFARLDDQYPSMSMFVCVVPMNCLSVAEQVWAIVACAQPASRGSAHMTRMMAAGSR